MGFDIVFFVPTGYQSIEKYFNGQLMEEHHGITYLNGMDAASEAECLVNKGMTVSYSELQPGDLIFYSYSANGKYRNISHVAIYLGNGEMVHAADESRGVCKQAMSQSNLSPQLYCRPQ